MLSAATPIFILFLPVQPKPCILGPALRCCRSRETLGQDTAQQRCHRAFALPHCDSKAENLEGTCVLSVMGLYWQREGQLCHYCLRHWGFSPSSFYSKSSSSSGDLVQLTFYHLPHIILMHDYAQSSPVRSSVLEVSSHLFKHLFWDALAGTWPPCDLTQVFLLQLMLQREVFSSTLNKMHTKGSHPCLEEQISCSVVTPSGMPRGGRRR